ncbi:zinc/manganese transport system substrate-binding protein [Pseudonocardia thermophila]|jgi:ABC-type metal ion transport system, periplasmic component/surface adhesin|uniref:Zinc/manganese transport system substrate-binding protein n=1 Tax=Pseudonocardia thermophila TaxID=1848 RepID=A0A1M6UNQ3_PSETH|nr:zinc ABC transporter substrate-binding protein [Pseudonocardia thermophila]SHK70885.1 zinc/manganese transport system substrate-binding protein [Pseudonocardia thermophila]
MPTRSRPAAVLAAVGATAALLLSACGSGTQSAPAESAATVPVVTTTNVYGAIAEAVGGDRVRVTSLMNDAAADPHSFEATPADAADVAEARVVVLNGGGYDDFATKLVETSGDRTVIDVVELSGLKAGGDEEFNEHVWYSLPTVAKLAERLAADLAAIDPAGADAYRANAARFTEQVAGLQQRLDAIKARAAGQRVAVTEPVPGYLVEAAGLVDATPAEFAEAIEEDTDPPVAVLQETLDLFSGTPVRVLIVNTQTTTPTTDQVERAAQTAGVPVVGVSETLPEGQTDYISWMGGQIDALGAALDR